MTTTKETRAPHMMPPAEQEQYMAEVTEEVRAATAEMAAEHRRDLAAARAVLGGTQDEMFARALAKIQARIAAQASQ